jgi:two-component system response regulator AtoC
VDDEKLLRHTLSEALKSWGYTPSEAEDLQSGLAQLEADPPDAVLLDVHLPDGSGIDLLGTVKSRDADAVVIMMTGSVHLDDTIAALRGGAYDFVTKPINLEELRVTIRNGIEATTLRSEVGKLRSERAQRFSFDQIIGESDPMREILMLARKVAESEVSNVLLQGESGTGKDLVAKAIHYGSRRSAGPFVAINCAALPATLIESELFGYEKGAFTDAKARKEGLFEQAEGGTIFLDEIGELEHALQAKLLRVFEEGAFRRVGGLKDIPFDARIIAASNRDLRAESEAGKFRLDLYYRLSVIQIDIPPMRDRGDDVILLASHYINSLATPLRRKIRGLDREVVRIFKSYPWPGNVRELRNVIERSIILEDGDMITTRYLPPNLSRSAGGPVVGDTSSDLFVLPRAGISLETLEKSLVRQALDQCSGNQTRAAAMLGISRDQLRYRMKKMEEDSTHAEA